MSQVINSMSEEEKQTRRTLGQQSVDAWGTAFVLTARFKRWSVLRRVITLSGVLVPVIIGLLYISFTTVLKEEDWLAFAASLFLTLHAVGSIVVAVWANEDKAYILHESAARNRNIAIRSDRLAKNIALGPEAFSALAQELIAEYRALEEHDENRLGATQAERRRGTRAGLFRFKRNCLDCSRIPAKERRLWERKSCSNCGEPLNGNNKGTTSPSGNKQP